MKVAVINFSGNVGKSTVARHLLQPRLAGAELISVESLNATEGQAQTIRGRQFADLQEYLQTVDRAIVDIGASNVEQLLELMRQYRGSHEDFDAFVVPTVPAIKQQQDTIATLVELARIGIPSAKVRLLFNMVDESEELARSFRPLLNFVAEHPVAEADPACRLSNNEIFSRLKSTGMDIAALVGDTTDYKALIAQARDTSDKIALAQRLATRRLAHGVLPHQKIGDGVRRDRRQLDRHGSLRYGRAGLPVLGAPRRSAAVRVRRRPQAASACEQARRP